MVKIGVSTSKNPNSSSVFLACIAAVERSLKILYDLVDRSSKNLFLSLISSFTLSSLISKGIGLDLFSITSFSKTISILPVFKFGFSSPSPRARTKPVQINTNSSLTISASLNKAGSATN